MAFCEALSEFTIERLIVIRQNKEALIRKHKKEIERGSKREFPRLAILKLSREIELLDKELQSRGHIRRTFKKPFTELFR